MCEINPKHKAEFRLEVFTSHGMSRETFMVAVLGRLLKMEQLGNSKGDLRFHIHEKED
jgi:hypothetical protein